MVADRHLMTLFSAALDQPPGERAAYLDQACAGDVELRAQVEALLAAHDQIGGFLERGPAPNVPTVTADPADGPPGPLTSTAPWTPLLEAPGATIGRYKLLEKIGEGGMGIVYKAEQVEPVKRKVALKVIKTGMDSRQVIARFEAERQALALMDHPNIAKVFDGGLHEGRPYFVMELVKGVPITEYCDERKLTPKERLELFIPVCQALQHAHQKGIIHRDIKPSNVLIALYDDKPVPKVIDFGVAKATGGTLTEHSIDTSFGAVVGTLQYMSPEQATLNNLDIDTRSDVYSLGVLLYELLTGTTPIEQERIRKAALLEVLRVVREEEAPRPSDRLSTTDELPSIAARRGVEPWRLGALVRGDLDWVVMKALEKDRGRRYETAIALGRDIQRFLNDEPVEAGAPSRAHRVRKFVRRNRRGVVTAGLVALALVFGAVGTGWQAIRAANALEAEARRAEAVERAKRETAEAEAARLRDGMTAAARVALERGDVRRMLALLAEAEAAGLPIEPEWRLEIARARFSLGEDAEAERELAKIDLASADPVTRSGALMLHAELTILTDAVRSLALIQQAERGPLSDADRAYVRGLRSGSCPEALVEFQAAIAADPRHIAARQMATITALLLGQQGVAHRLAAESQLLYPEHATTIMLVGLTEAAAGNQKALAAAWEKLGNRIDGHPLTVLAFLFTVFQGVWEYGKESPINPISDPALKTLIQELTKNGGIRLFQLRPEQCAPFLRPLMTLFSGQLLPLVDIKNGVPSKVAPRDLAIGPNGEKFLDAFRVALDAHPEGSLRLLYGYCWYERARTRPAAPGGKPDPARARLYALAGASLAKAATEPMVFDARRDALDLAVTAYIEAGRQSPDGPVQNELFRKAADTVEARLRAFGLPAFPSLDRTNAMLSICTFATLQGGEVQVARRLLDEMDRLNPNSPSLILRAQVELAGESYLKALEVASRALDRPTLKEPFRGQMLQVWTDAGQKLSQVRIIEPAPPPRPAKR